MYLLYGAALLASSAQEIPSASPNQAEFIRLSQEIEKLAARNAWTGVERAWPLLEATQVPPTFEVLLAGAHSARALGNVDAARARLDVAKTLREEREVIEWIFDIDQHYGRALLACDPARHPAGLEPDAPPFNPSMQRAIEFARGLLADGCYFEGLLPEGSYKFVAPDGRAFTFKVVPRVQTQTVDLRTTDRRKPKH